MVHHTLSALQSWMTISPSSVVTTRQRQRQSRSKPRWQPSSDRAQRIWQVNTYPVSRKTLMASRGQQGHAAVTHRSITVGACPISAFADTLTDMDAQILTLR